MLEALKFVELKKWIGMSSTFPNPGDAQAEGLTAL